MCDYAFYLLKLTERTISILGDDVNEILATTKKPPDGGDGPIS
jgi:hypothetical protein